MGRMILICLIAAGCAGLSAQQPAGGQDPYQGVSRPPSDDTITVAEPVQAQPAKPAAGKLLVQPQGAPAGKAEAAQPAAVDPSLNDRNPDVTGDDDGIVQVANPNTGMGMREVPALAARNAGSDPDGDIVHPEAYGPGVLAPGTQIRIRLETMLSTVDSARGDEFRGRVASDVMQSGQVLIPTGAEIYGRVVEVSSGRAGGHGSMRLRPDTVVLPDGSRYRLSAQVTETPGSNANVSGEGTINGGSRYKKDGIEYGGGVGAGVVTGAVLGGPAGALAGGLIGAGAITVHLLMDHPQAVLEPGAVLIFSLNDRLDLQGAKAAGD